MQILTKHIPPKLYHYTSKTGLMGIINSKNIWMTNIQYFNDHQEYKYGINKFTSKLIESRILSNDIANKFCNQLNGLESAPLINPYVCSFSERGDLLSQWRGYCPATGGYSIGFKFDKTSNLMNYSLDSNEWRQVIPYMTNAWLNTKTISFYLAPCIYDTDTQDQLIDVLIESIGILYNLKPIYQTNLFFLLAIMPIFKHPSFSEEKEWRLVSLGHVKSETVSFRENSSLIVPYIERPITYQDINEIIIGPTSFPDLTKKSLIILASKYSLTTNVIRISDIPYRAW